jgi:hypothetical protein
MVLSFWQQEAMEALIAVAQILWKLQHILTRLTDYEVFMSAVIRHQQTQLFACTELEHGCTSLNSVTELQLVT